MYLLGQTHGAQCATVATASFRSTRYVTAIEVDDVAMAKSEKVIDTHDGSTGVVAAHRVHAAHLARNCNQRHAGRHLDEPGRRQTGPDQHHGLTAIVDESAQGTFLIAVWGHSTEHHLIPGIVRRDVHGVDQVGVKLLPGSECCTEHPAPVLSQSAGARIGPIADVVGHATDPRPRRLAGTRGIAHHDRHQRP